MVSFRLKFVASKDDSNRVQISRSLYFISCCILHVMCHYVVHHLTRDDVDILFFNQCNQPIFSTIMKNTDILYIFVTLYKTFTRSLEIYLLNFFSDIIMYMYKCQKRKRVVWFNQWIAKPVNISCAHFKHHWKYIRETKFNSTLMCIISIFYVTEIKYFFLLCSFIVQ